MGLFGIGWVIDLFLLPEFVEEHNKKVFHQQMLETGTTLLFDGEYGGQTSAPYYPSAPPAFGNQVRARHRAPPQKSDGVAAAEPISFYLLTRPRAPPPPTPQAPYASHVYYPQPTGGGKGGAYDGSYY